MEIFAEPIVLSVKTTFAKNVLKGRSQQVLLVALTAHLVQDPLMEYVYAQVDSFTTTTVWPLVLQDLLVLMVSARLVRALALLALELLTSV